MAVGYQTVTLAWDPNPEPDVCAYVVYYGTQSRGYPLATNVGNVTTATVYGLDEGRTYYFAITARNLSGLESNFSNEVTNAIPAELTNKAPTISIIADRVTTEDTVVGPLPFVVGDADTAVANLTVSGYSTNTALVPDARVVFGGSGSNRTVTLHPATNAIGCTRVVVVVSDGIKASSTSFLVTVHASADPFDNWLRTRFSAQDLADSSRAAEVWDSRADPDKDAQDNLQEYAFGMDPLRNKSSAEVVIPAVVTATNGACLALTFPRRKNDASLVYTVEVSSNKADWTGQTAVRQTAVQPIDAEFENVTFQDASPIEPAHPRFIRLRLTHHAVVESVTDTYMGMATVIRGALPSRPRTTQFSLPVVNSASAVGVVTDRGTVSITDTNARWSSGQFAPSNGAFYAEFESGYMADIVACSTQTLEFPGSLPSEIVVGQVYRVRPHFTLASILGAANKIGLEAGTSPANADMVELAVRGEDGRNVVRRCYFYSSVPGYTGWYDWDCYGAADTVVYPEQALGVTRKQGGDILLVVSGVVKDNPTIVPILVGNNLVGTFQNQRVITLGELNLVSGDPVTGLAAGWNPGEADNVYVVNPDQTTSTFFYSSLAGYEGWWTAACDRRADDTAFEPGSAFYVTRKAPRAPFNWRIPSE
ncbi:MAG: fibronectin type III domain-containing protein [Verrucomicrobia bacterium]|nr:fibronectin type III domain-containing protein [Verrucomicrobiota bacterium]